MTRIRYLTPFVIFLALLMVSAAVTYYFYNEQVRLEAETEEIEELVLQDGSLYQGALERQGQLKLIAQPVGAFADPSATGEPVAYTPGQIGGRDYVEAMQNDNAWLRAQLARVRRFVHAKSQHPLDFIGTSALRPAEQHRLALAQANQLEQEVDASVQFVLRQQANRPGSGILDPGQTVDDETAARHALIHAAVQAQLQDMTESVAAIIAELNTIGNLIGNDPLREFHLAQIRQAYTNASHVCDRLITQLSYTRIREDGREKEVAIPGLIDSRAKRMAIRLLFFLDPNDVEALQRPLPDAQAGTEMASYIAAVLAASGGGAGVPASDVAFRALVDDAARAPSQRQYDTSPWYLADATLEEVVDNQDLMIHSLLHMNHLLADRLMVALAMYHADDPRKLRDGEGGRRGSAWQGTRGSLNDNRLTNEGVADSVEAHFGNLGREEEDRSDDVALTIDTTRDDVADAYVHFLNTERAALERDKERLDRSVERLNNVFFDIKRNGRRHEGVLRLDSADGTILWRDNVDGIYHIDLGRGDHIKRGMRFLVFSELGGDSEIKALIEVVRIPRNNFAVCRLVHTRDGASEILVGDRIENRLYHEGRFLRVACLGEFVAPNTTISRVTIEQYLLELGCTVDPQPDVHTELVILSHPIEQMVPVPAISAYVRDLRPRVHMDEVVAEDLMIYFEDQ